MDLENLLGIGPNDVTSLLGNIFSGGAVGQPSAEPAGPMQPGAEPLPRQYSDRQGSRGLDALMAAARSLNAAARPTLAPRGSTMGAVMDAMAAGREAVRGNDVLEQAGQDAQLRRAVQMQELQRQQNLSTFFQQFMTGRQQAAAATPGTGGAVAPASGAGTSIADVLGGAESGNNYRQVNAGGYSGRWQIGAPLAKDAGVYSPGEGEIDPTTGAWNGKWGGVFNIPAFPNVRTHADFLNNPDAQRAAFDQALSYHDRQLGDLGVYDRGVGKTIAGVPVTREGLQMGAWLGGPGGVKAWVDSDGKVDRKDGNGTAVSQWVALGSRIGAAPAGGAVFAGPGVPTDTTATGSGGVPPAPPVPLAPGATGTPPAAPPGAPAGAPAPAGSPAAGGGGTLLSSIPRDQLALLALLGPKEQEQALAKLITDGPPPVTIYTDPTGTWALRRDGTKYQLGPPAPAPTVELEGPDGKPHMFARTPGGLVDLGLARQPTVRVEEFSDGKWTVDEKGNKGQKLGDLPTPPPTVELQGEDGKMHTFVRTPSGLVDLGIGKQSAPQTVTLGDSVHILNPDSTLGPKLGPRPTPEAKTVVIGNDTYALKPDGSLGEKLGPKAAPAPTQVVIGDDVYKVNPDGTRGERLGPRPTPEPKTIIIGNDTYQLKPDGSLGEKLGPRPTPPPPPQTEFQKERDKAAAAVEKGITDGAQHANDMLPKLDQWDAIARTGPQGKFAPAYAQIGAVASAMGVNLDSLGVGPKTATNAQLMTKVGNELAMGLISRGNGPGLPANNFSEADRTFITQTVMQMTNTQEANALLSAFMRSGANRLLEQQRAFMALTPEQRANPEAVRQFAADWSQKIAKQPLVVAAPVPSDKTGALPAGTIYQGTDGRWRQRGGG